MEKFEKIYNKIINLIRSFPLSLSQSLSHMHGHCPLPIDYRDNLSAPPPGQGRGGEAPHLYG